MNEVTSIKDKLAKLLRLSEGAGASQGEIDNALKIASQLMTKYQLTREDIDMDAVDPVARVRMGRHFAFSKAAKITSWEGQAAMFVSDFIGSVSCYIDRSKHTARAGGIAKLDDEGNPQTAAAVCFYGSDDDAECAVEMFNELRDSIATMAIVRWGGWARGDGAGYAEGFVSALKDKLATNQDNLLECDEKTHALILASQFNSLAIVEKGKDWLAKEFNVKLTKGSSGGGSRAASREARSEGRRDGKAYDASRPTLRRKIA